MSTSYFFTASFGCFAGASITNLHALAFEVSFQLTEQTKRVATINRDSNHRASEESFFGGHPRIGDLVLYRTLGAF
jgi:hypothetical protein